MIGVGGQVGGQRIVDHAGIGAAIFDILCSAGLVIFTSRQHQGEAQEEKESTCHGNVFCVLLVGSKL